MIEAILNSLTIRGARHAAGKIYEEHKGERGKDWGQAEVQKAVVIAKEQIKGVRPARRARNGRNDEEMSKQ